MRFTLHDEDGLPLRKFWSRSEAEKFMLEGYWIDEKKKEKRKKVSRVSHLQQLIAEVGEAPY